MNDLDTESGDDFKNVESATLMRVSSFNKLSINELRNHYAGHNRPRIRLNGAVISLKPIFVYLRKQVADSTIILELSFQDAMTCCCFYLVDTTLTSGMFPRKDFLTRKSDEMRHTASAVSESTFLSTSIHLKAFLYDFHLRHLYFYLDVNSNNLD